MKFPEKQLRQIELTEKFNIQNARRLLLSDLIDLDGKKRLKKYLSNFEGDTGDYTENYRNRRQEHQGLSGYGCEV